MVVLEPNESTSSALNLFHSLVFDPVVRNAHDILCREAAESHTLLLNAIYNDGTNLQVSHFCHRVDQLLSNMEASIARAKTEVFNRLSNAALRLRPLYRFPYETFIFDDNRNIMHVRLNETELFQFNQGDAAFTNIAPVGSAFHAVSQRYGLFILCIRRATNRLRELQVHLRRVSRTTQGRVHFNDRVMTIQQIALYQVTMTYVAGTVSSSCANLRRALSGPFNADGSFNNSVGMTRLRNWEHTNFTQLPNFTNS